MTKSSVFLFFAGLVLLVLVNIVQPQDWRVRFAMIAGGLASAAAGEVVNYRERRRRARDANQLDGGFSALKNASATPADAPPATRKDKQHFTIPGTREIAPGLWESCGPEDEIAKWQLPDHERLNETRDRRLAQQPPPPQPEPPAPPTP